MELLPCLLGAILSGDGDATTKRSVYNEVFRLAAQPTPHDALRQSTHTELAGHGLDQRADITIAGSDGDLMGGLARLRTSHEWN